MWQVANDYPALCTLHAATTVNTVSDSDLAVILGKGIMMQSRGMDEDHCRLLPSQFSFSGAGSVQSKHPQMCRDWAAVMSGWTAQCQGAAPFRHAFSKDVCQLKGNGHTISQDPAIELGMQLLHVQVKVERPCSCAEGCLY